ncbi:DNA polymerase/3'-5' exonuclease PolX [Actinomycetota bacterium]
MNNITDKKQIVKILNKTATLLELGGANFFKVRAYHIAASALESSDIEIEKDISVPVLQEIKGIGANIARHIKELIDNGTFKEYEDLKKTTPPGLIEMLKIPGMGAKKIHYLFDTLQIADIDTLELACKKDKLMDLPGFGKKSQENILKGIRVLRKYQEKYLYGEVISEAVAVIEKIKSRKEVIRASLGGSVRRKNEIVKDIDIVASTADPLSVMDFFTNMDEAEDIIAKGNTKSSIRIRSGINIDIRTVTDEQYPYALHHFTGSKEHNTAMRSMAKKMGIKMNEYGLFKDDKLIKCKSEEDIFAVFSMDFIPPELRENFGEIEAAKKGTLPDLVKDEDIRGLIHIHTNYSDGHMTLEQTVGEAKKMGLKYIGISEHSRSAWYAGGMQEKDIDSHLEDIDRLNKKLKDFKIFKGIESDILNDGSLDYSDEILQKFEFVIIAIHSNFNMARDQMTERIIKAVQNPFSTILAHPTGRLLLERDPYEVDIKKVIDEVSIHDVALELNANPSRLDLDWRSAKYAHEKGVKVFINPDAHSIDTLYDYSFGINIARKGWLESKDIANTLSLKQMETYLKNKKGKTVV